MYNMDKELIKQNYNKIKSIVGDVEIVPATKTQDIETIKYVQSLGVKVFGENKVQEWKEKKDCGAIFDFIGTLQKNKVKYLVGEVRYISSVDRLDLAKEISSVAIKKHINQDILMEVNLGKELSKSGVFIENAFELAYEIEKLQGITLKGIMVVTPKTTNKIYLKQLFLEGKDLFERLKKEFSSVSVYSGGMSENYDIAIECGVTSIRPGRALFGDRLYK